MVMSYIEPNFFSSLQTGRRVLEAKHLWLGNDSHIETPTRLTPELMPLPQGMIIIGNVDNVGQASNALLDLNTEVTQLGDEVTLLQNILGNIQQTITTLFDQLANQQLTLMGDILATGLISGPIATRFADNPVFHGHSITLAGGSVEERPSDPTVGMLRYCI